MYFSRLNITGFRNLESVETDLSEHRNLIFGPNGSGKSNLLEAVYYLCTSKSFRGASDDLIKGHDAELFRIVGEGVVEGRSTSIEIAYQPGEKKRIKIDGVPQSKLASLYEYFRVVFFGPDDVDLVYGPPSIRRRFLDISIAQLRSDYIPLLWEYKKTMAQRNALLKEFGEAYNTIGTIDGDELLSVWDDKLVELGLRIRALRADFIDNVSRIAADYYRRITAGDNGLSVSYKASPSLEEPTAEQYHRKLRSRRSRELMMGQSMYGPHRDDLVFLLSDIDCRSYASRGQVKSAVLSVKLAVLDHIRELCDEPPILLLDEIYSDLDRNRLELLIPMLDSFGQVLITTSKLEEVKDLDVFENALQVGQGFVKKYIS